jgi:hypothetical protein
MATQFEEELEIFRTETQKATQCFYAFLSVHAVAADRDAVRRLLNMAALFWNTSLGALQTSTFIALGRIFDQGSRHNVDSLFKTAQDDLAVFSKDALATRKQGTNPVPPEWLAEYLRTAYVPTATDFRRLRGYVRRYRKTNQDIGTFGGSTLHIGSSPRSRKSVCFSGKRISASFNACWSSWPHCMKRYGSSTSMA